MIPRRGLSISAIRKKDIDSTTGVFIRFWRDAADERPKPRGQAQHSEAYCKKEGRIVNEGIHSASLASLITTTCIRFLPKSES